MEAGSIWSRQLEALRLRSQVGVQATGGREAPSCFDLRIPWCNTHLNWKVIFDTHMPSMAPDFIFNDDTFFPLHPRCLEEAHRNPIRESLISWAGGDCMSLQRVTSALLQGYRYHQTAKMRALNDARLQFELETLPSDRPMEFLLENGSEGQRQACFCFSLEDVNLKDLHSLVYPPCYGEPSSPCNPFKLLISFGVFSTSPPTVSLQAPAWLTGLAPPIDCPSWRADDCMSEFLPTVVTSLQQQVQNTIERLRNRGMIFEGLKEVLGPPLETSYGRKPTACFPVVHGHVQFLLFLSVGLGFPEDKPEIWVQNARRPTRQGPVLPLTMARWSPRWPRQEMAKRVVGFLRDEIQRLKNKGDI
ncbi:unnamed protein product [Ostreobium quekettii]|uniref:BRISC and BRCA1-A complex member 2 n=1 Tax=Ostreobium quekettii TaxID=121088 RepID=A0A8S1J375_9CHLO|nr:unnamed protein product [Ostreobium quekettii]|eukprot:evm.model.scf_1928.2 EVM.evm.TU.scf_1928.2   scf_1928:9655-15102(-)